MGHLTDCPQISRSSVFRWRVVTKRSEISFHIVWEANGKPYAASSNQPLHLTSIDLEAHVSRSSVFGNSDKWRVVAKRSEISDHIIWGANRKPYAASSKTSLHLTSVDLETHISKSSVLGNNDKWHVVAKRSDISAYIVWGANIKPYPPSSNSSLHLTCVDLETRISRSSVFKHSGQR